MAPAENRVARSRRATAQPVTAVSATARGADGIDRPGLVRIEPDPERAVGRALSLGGDSGALWFEADTGRAVGLHVQGEPGVAWATPALAIERALGIVWRAPDPR